MLVQSFFVFSLLFLLSRAKAEPEPSTTKAGGTGGLIFPKFTPKAGSTIGIRTGSLVDAIVLDGTRYGGGGGGLSVMTLDDGEFINSFYIRAGNIIDFISFSTNKGKSIGGRGDGG